MDDCAYKGCDKLGIYKYEGKWYCPNHYTKVITKDKKEDTDASNNM